MKREEWMIYLEERSSLTKQLRSKICGTHRESEEHQFLLKVFIFIGRLDTILNLYQLKESTLPLVKKRKEQNKPIPRHIKKLWNGDYDDLGFLRRETRLFNKD